jgi:hypothetical protein
MKWFQRQRIDWIKETIRVYGYMNREHVMRKFGISIAQVSDDFSYVTKETKDVFYNKKMKRYESFSRLPVGNY